MTAGGSTVVPAWCHIQLSNDFYAWRGWSRHENWKQNLEHNRPCIQTRIQASIEPIVSHLPKSRMLEILEHTAKWRLGVTAAGDSRALFSC